MNISPLDWLIVACLLGCLVAIALASRRYSHSVSDFLAGNRCAGRYLLTMSEGAAGLGMVGMVANFEQFYHAGFAASWWGNILAPVGLVIALSGWVVYRFRETRALTMAQFFEMRYSRRFRIFAGILAWFSGILNYGIFPSIVARFLIYFCGIPQHLSVWGISVPAFPLVMLVMLSFAVIFTTCGGMITVMITDFCQAQFINLAFLVVMVVLFVRFSWSTIVATLVAAPAHHSMVNPFDQSGVEDFNVWFFLILAFKLIYNCLGWQGTQGFNASAKSPHEAKMARVLAEWRNGVTFLMIMLMPICAYVLLHGPDFAAQAAAVQSSLSGIPDAQLRGQVTVPISLVHILPSGVAGLLLAAMIAAAIGNDSTCLHSWGSIFIQDVILPFRKTPISTEMHLRLLRGSIIGVATFAFFFSLVFPLRDFIFMYFLITGAVYLGGSGAVIVGGLYWKRGTTAAAWASLIVGGVFASGGAGLRIAWPHIERLRQITPEFPINGAWMALIASLIAICVYIGVSLATCRAPFDLDRILHRGVYAITGSPGATASALPRWKKRLGISEEFTRGDQCIYFFKISWTLFWFTTFLIGSVWAMLGHITDPQWAHWWLFTIMLSATVGFITIVWFLWGGVRDLREMLSILKGEKIDPNDDGTVPVEQGTLFRGAHAPRVLVAAPPPQRTL